MGSHRMPRKQSVMTRTVAAGGVAAGGAACCLGLLGDGTAPTANAFSTTFVEPNGTTVQLNILQGNVILPQFGLAGNSSNISTIGNTFAGNGNGNTTTVGVLSTGSGSQTTNVAVSNGNVVQIDILSGNVFNPQLSLLGGNSSNTSTIGNASIGNGNGNTTGVGVTSTGSGSQTTNVTTSEGNSTQNVFGSGNVFNPQLSLLGGNSGATSTFGNIAAGNGNGNTTGVTSIQTGSAPLGGNSVGVTTNEGNSTQKTNLSGNIINPQLSSGLGSGTPLSTPFSLGSRTPLSTPVSSAASVNGGTPRKH
jgi:hypothetical protein